MKAWPTSSSAELASCALPTTSPDSLMPLAELRTPPKVPSACSPEPGDQTKACQVVGSRPSRRPTTCPSALRSQTEQPPGQISVWPPLAL